MNKATITLELNYEHIAKVMAFLHSLSASHTAPSEPKPVKEVQETIITEKDVIKATVVPITAGKKTVMPGFGRSQGQIDAFTTEEQEKFNKKSEEQLLREERTKERLLKKEEKDLEIAEKKADKQKIQKEIDEIKALEKDTPLTPMPLKKPWEL